MSTNHLVKNDHGASKNDLAENQLATKLNLVDSALTFERLIMVRARMAGV